MTTTVTKSIGTSSRDYSTLQAWFDDAPADLTSVDQIWRGECYNDSEFTGTLTLSGKTVDSTRYVELTAAAGQSFQDNANVRTNALRYNVSNGVGLRRTASFDSVINVGGSQQFTRISRLQMKSEGDASNTLSSGISLTSGELHDLLLEGRVTSGGALLSCGGRNCWNIVMVVSGSGTDGCAIRNTDFTGNYTLDHATIVYDSANTASTSYAIFEGACSGAPKLYNCAVFGFNSLFNNEGRITDFRNCATDLAGTTYDGISGSSAGTLNSKTYSNQFVNTSTDFRQKSGADLTNAGSSAVGLAPTNDISITAYGANPDIGAWELTSSGTTFNISCTEAAAATDTEHITVVDVISRTETVTATTVEHLVDTVVISRAEAASAATVQHFDNGVFVSRSEALSATDTEHYLVAFSTSRTEALGAADAPHYTAIMGISRAETLAATDTEHLVTVMSISRTEALVAVDSPHWLEIALNGTLLTLTDTEITLVALTDNDVTLIALSDTEPTTVTVSDLI